MTTQLYYCKWAAHHVRVPLWFVALRYQDASSSPGQGRRRSLYFYLVCQRRQGQCASGDNDDSPMIASCLLTAVLCSVFMTGKELSYVSALIDLADDAPRHSPSEMYATAQGWSSRQYPLTLYCFSDCLRPNTNRKHAGISRQRKLRSPHPYISIFDGAVAILDSISCITRFTWSVYRKSSENIRFISVKNSRSDDATWCVN